MIVFINGPAGVGKSTIAGLLRNTFANSVKLDIDHLTGVNPLPDDSFGEAHYAFVARTLRAIVPHYQNEGYPNVIIPYVFEHRYQLISCVKSISKPGQKIFTFCLRGSEETLLQRVTNRSNGFAPHHRESRLQHEKSRSIELKHILDKKSLTGELGELVETDGRSPPEIANDIVQRIRTYSTPSIPPNSMSVTFASKYVDWILDDLKLATTRRITASTIVPPQNVAFFAVVRGQTTPFGVCWCHSIESTTCETIDDKLANMENLPNGEALMNELKLYYPDITLQSPIYVQKFFVQHFFPPAVTSIAEK
eukprot:TRINITY_DN8823_c0_g1_i1.p1 TRINITY_DN8823_c0_g1~~TRINITY_DN8823_c0_g1_i1.p1  ORF type:complete len:308 (-),score=36.78 TRINITY_DN8823_c0_g1_i1:79-1002(-)